MKIIKRLLLVFSILLITLTSITASADAYDKALLHFNGADGSTTFTDESGKIWTAAGNAQIDTAQSVFGGASGLFDGTGDYISTGNHGDFNFGTNDFTIDFWIRRNGNQDNYDMVITTGEIATTKWYISFLDQKILFAGGADGSGVNITSTSIIPNTTWTHIAIIRYGNTVYLAINGVLDATGDATGKTINSGGLGLQIGQDLNNLGTLVFAGWIDEVRISKGIARWTSNFTPPNYEYGSEPTSTPTNAATNTATNTPTITATFTPSNTATNTPTNTATFTPTFTYTPTDIPTNTPTFTFTPSITNTPIFTFTPTIITTPTDTLTPTITNTPQDTPEFVLDNTVSVGDVGTTVAISLLCLIIIIIAAVVVIPRLLDRKGSI